MSCAPSHPTTFPISKSFTEKIILPSLNKWIVAAEEVVISGGILSMTKRKGLLFVRRSSIKFRQIFITKHSYALIYTSDTKGFVLDLQKAVKLKTSTTPLWFKKNKSGTSNLKRTQIEIKMSFGSLFLSFLGNDALRWIEALYSNKTPDMPIEENKSVMNVIDLSMEDGEEETMTMQTMVESPVRQPSVVSLPKTYIWRRAPSPLPPTTSFSDPTMDHSIRQGQHSVATLRLILERKAKKSLVGEKKRRHSLCPVGYDKAIRSWSSDV